MIRSRLWRGHHRTSSTLDQKPDSCKKLEGFYLYIPVNQIPLRSLASTPDELHIHRYPFYTVHVCVFISQCDRH